MLKYTRQRAKKVVLGTRAESSRSCCTMLLCGVSFALAAKAVAPSVSMVFLTLLTFTGAIIQIMTEITFVCGFHSASPQAMTHSLILVFEIALPFVLISTLASSTLRKHAFLLFYLPTLDPLLSSLVHQSTTLSDFSWPVLSVSQLREHLKGLDPSSITIGFDLSSNLGFTWRLMRCSLLLAGALMYGECMFARVEFRLCFGRRQKAALAVLVLACMTGTLFGVDDGFMRTEIRASLLVFIVACTALLEKDSTPFSPAEKKKNPALKTE
uniref:Uncharacterized protein n=1 Tax=Erythrolobus madagascarensis TaxID=708628 RepID=A0A7S0XJ20_9RHOD|mmetsp:Transcript_1960/g.4306  ORF Transcript_1960/g.4306 Transcript_1960/m.4306 type:complete len:269 (+) Transcript_1960:173-979(+)